MKTMWRWRWWCWRSSWPPSSDWIRLKTLFFEKRGNVYVPYTCVGWSMPASRVYWLRMRLSWDQFSNLRYNHPCQVLMKLENRSWLNYTNFVNIFLSFQWKQYRKLIFHPRYQSPNQNYANKIFPHQRSLEPKPSICRRYHLLNYRLCLSSIHPPEKPLHIQNYELPFISIIKSNDQVNTNRKLKFLLNKIPKKFTLL